jgi:hypothetical protein
MKKWFQEAETDKPNKLPTTLLDLTPPKGEAPLTEEERPVGFYGKWPPDAVVSTNDADAAREHMQQEREQNEAYLAAYEAEIAAKALVKSAEDEIVTLDTEFRAKLKDARAKVTMQQEREQSAKEARRVAHVRLLDILDPKTKTPR